MAPWADRFSWTAGRRWDLTTADSRLVDDLKAPSGLQALRPRKVSPPSEGPTKLQFARNRKLTPD
jgi:hypothetical protein